MKYCQINECRLSECLVTGINPTKLSLSDEECMAHDKDVIGAAGIFWLLILSSSPIEVPHLASRYIKPGSVL